MSTKRHMPALIRAIERGLTADALGCLEATPALVHGLRPRSALWLAARHGNATLVEALLELGADPQLVGWDGTACCLPEKPVHVAAREGHAEVVAILRPHHEPLGIIDACALNDQARVADLLRDDPALANHQEIGDADGRFLLTPLHWAVFGGRRELIADLFAAGATGVPAPDPSRSMSLHRLPLALCRGYSDIAATLMAAGDVPTTEPEICIAYSQAAYSQNPACIALLRDAGYDVNARRVDAEHCAFVHVRHPRFEPWKALLDCGVNLNAARRNGKTMLHIAAALGLTTFVDELLARGANTTLPDNKQMTPIDYARGRKNQKLYEHLVAIGVAT